MTHTFDATGRLVIIPVFVAGPGGGHDFNFAVDTGATRSAVRGVVLERLGYTASQARGRFQLRTGSGGSTTGVVAVARFGAFGRVEANYPVLWLPLPATSRIDGLLGLDFFRGQVLTLDFARGRVSLNPPRKWWQVWR